MKTWLISDGKVVWACNGMDMVAVTDPGSSLSLIAERTKEWAFLGWCSNTVKPDGVPEIPVNPDLVNRMRAKLGV